MATNWRSLLAFDDGALKLADALQAFIAAYEQQSTDQEKLHDEVVFQAGVYRMGHWALVKHFILGVTDCLDGIKKDTHFSGAFFKPNLPLALTQQARAAIK